MGIDIIDNQHKRLLDAINQLHHGLSDPRQDRTQAFRDAARQCVAYVKDHFSTEETLLQEKAYPGYPAQKAAHAYFVRRLLADSERFETGDHLAPNRFVRFLAEWLVSHIAIEDQKYAAYFRANDM